MWIEAARAHRLPRRERERDLGGGRHRDRPVEGVGDDDAATGVLRADTEAPALEEPEARRLDDEDAARARLEQSLARVRIRERLVCGPRHRRLAELEEVRPRHR